MRRAIERFRSFVLPVTILVPLVGLMVGCIYIPTFEQTKTSGTSCFWAGPGSERSFVLKLEFDEAGIMRRTRGNEFLLPSPFRR